MRIKYLFYIFFIVLTFLSKRSIAQSMSMADLPNIKVSQLTDEQITQAWKKLQDSGISEQDAYKLLQQKGMPAGEVEELKNRVTLLGLNKKAPVKSASSAEKQKNRFYKDCK